MRMPGGADNVPRQAVIIADSFNSRFKPITLQRPRCLLPLVNKPLIDYTIQHLIDNGFYDMIILCCSHADKISQHINESRFMERDERVNIQNITVSSESCLSFGDAMRQLSNDGVIRGPFVLVTGDNVSNMDLRAAMEAHQANKRRDKEAIMTCIFKKVEPGHPTRGLEDDIVVCMNPESKQLLRFQNANVKKLYYELEMFNSNQVVDFRYDLMNTYIILCEAHVPSRFGDHFDVQDMESFIKGIIEEEETCSETIYIHLLKNEYAARVSNLRTYNSVSQDIIHRWVYPVVPDNNTPPDVQYIYRRRGIYLPNSVRPYKAKIIQNTVIGLETTIGRDTEICNTVIGSKCEIGSNVRITNSFIWDEVTIKSDCVINNAMLCSGATVKRDTTVSDGCILSFDTVVGPNVKIQPNLRVTVAQNSHLRNDSECSNGSMESEETRCSDTDCISDSGDLDEQLGVDHWGYLYKSDDERADSDVEDNETEVSELNRKWYVGTPDVHTIDELSDSSDSTPVPSEPECEEITFYQELAESFRCGYANKTNIDHVILELNASKHAYNTSLDDSLMYATRGLLELCPDFKNDFPKYLKYFAPIFPKFSRDTHSQIIMLNEIQTWALERGQTAEVQKILHVMYNMDIIEEHNILEWEKSADQTVKCSIGKFITWLLEAEEESSDEESD